MRTSGQMCTTYPRRNGFDDGVIESVEPPGNGTKNDNGHGFGQVNSISHMNSSASVVLRENQKDWNQTNGGRFKIGPNL